MSHKYKIGEVVRIKENTVEYRDFDAKYFKILKELVPTASEMFSGRFFDVNKNHLFFGCLYSDEFEPLEKTLDNLEVGDEVINKSGETRVVLAAHPGLYAVSDVLNHESYSLWWTSRDLKFFGYTVKSSTPKPEPKEMTVGDVSKALGYEVKIIKE